MPAILPITARAIVERTDHLLPPNQSIIVLVITERNDGAITTDLSTNLSPVSTAEILQAVARDLIDTPPAFFYQPKPPPPHN